MNFGLVYDRTKKSFYDFRRRSIRKGQLGRGEVGFASISLIFCKTPSFDTSINILET